MKALNMIIGMVIITAIMAVLGQTGASFFLLKHLNIDIALQDLRPWIAYDYFMAYKDHPAAGEIVKIAFGGGFAPALLVLLLVIIVMLVKDSPLKTLYGNAKFATLPEMKKAGMAMTYKEITSEKTKWPAVILGQLNASTYLVDASQEYTTLAAPPGAGKGVSFVIPNLLTYPESIINFDPKSENFVITSGWRSKVLGQKVFRFSPDDKPPEETADTPAMNEASHCWNPLDYITENKHDMLADIRKITTLLIPAPDGENQSFFQGAQQALDGLLMYLMESPEEERTIYRAWEINNYPVGIEKWAAKTVSDREKAGKPLSSQCVNLLLAYANESEKKRDTTKGIINTYVSVFTDAKTRAATAKSDFDFNDLRKEKISVFVCIAPTNISRYSNMLNLFFSQALSVNTEVLPEDDPSLKYQCLALLDEFVALGKIELIRSSAGYTRAYNMRYAIIFQNLSQVSSIYGKEGAQSLLETMHNNIIFAVPDPDEAEKISRRLGNTTIRIREASVTRQQGGSSKSTSWQTHSRALMLPQEIQNMDYENQLMFKGGGRINPVFCKKIFWYKDKNFKNKARMPLPLIPDLVMVD